jgi:hypothetical protein
MRFRRMALSGLVLLAPSLASAAGLREGTPVPVRMTSVINSEDSKSGDPVAFIVTSNVVVDGVVVIARGTRATGWVLKARRSAQGFIWHDAKLTFMFSYTTATNGQPIRLRSSNLDPNGGHVVIDRDRRHHGLQWAAEGDTFEAYVDGNYDL